MLGRHGNIGLSPRIDSFRVVLRAWRLIDYKTTLPDEANSFRFVLISQACIYSHKSVSVLRAKNDVTES